MSALACERVILAEREAAVAHSMRVAEVRRGSLPASQISSTENFFLRKVGEPASSKINIYLSLSVLNKSPSTPCAQCSLFLLSPR